MRFEDSTIPKVQLSSYEPTLRIAVVLRVAAFIFVIQLDRDY